MKTRCIVRCVSWLCLGLCSGNGQLFGETIPGIFNTGVGSNGAVLTSGSVDPHWQLVQSADPGFPGPAARVVNDSGFPIPPWLANGPDSKWIAPQTSQSSGHPPGDYVYRLTFDLTGYDPATAVITGRWSSDNTGPDVRLNGIRTGLTGDGNFPALDNSFTLSSGFVAGINTLDFVVNNAGTGINPTGFRAELTGTADFEVPPGTPPSILGQPTSATVGLGDSLSFRVQARGSKPLRYQWRRNGSPVAGATNAILSIPGVGASAAGVYDVVVANAFGSATSDSATLSIIYVSPAEQTYEPLGPTSRRTGLVFSEIMYHPARRADGRNLEFVELYNSNPFFEDLSGYRLSGQLDYTFPPGTRIEGLSFLVVAPSPADVEAVYGLAGVLGGMTNRLANRGGVLRLRKKSGAIVLDLDYDDQPPWPVAADGTGHSLVLARPSYGERDPQAWAASFLIGGSPGAVDPVPSGPLENVVLNEILAHTELPQLDAIELYNHSPMEVDVSGCWLSDDPSTNKFQIPPGTVLPPRGFLAFDESQLGFGLSARGETIYWVRPDQQRVLDALRYSGQASGIAYGRFPDGAKGFQELIAPTPGAANAPILERDIVINEIMYHPISGDSDDEYVELYNRGANPMDLGGWRFLDGVDYAFPHGTTMAPGGFLVVARNRERLLTNDPGINPAIVLGDFGGTLADSGERLALGRPEAILETNAVNGVILTNTFFVVVDEVTYGDGGRWGQWSDGGGSSLELKDPRGDNRLPSNWADSDESAKSQWSTIEATGVLNLNHPAVSSIDQLHLFLLAAGEALVDDVEVIYGGVNRVTHPGFESGLDGWFFQGTQRPSYLETSEGFNSARALHLVATARGDVVNRVRTQLSAVLPLGATVTLRAKARWVRGHNELLLRLVGNSLEAVGALPLPRNLGTPGAPNSRAVANAGPAITAVTHRPVLPRAGESIRVTARVQDPDAVQAVSLVYRLDPSATRVTVAMTDDGAGGDQLDGDGIYSGLIPGQTSGQLVAFHVRATDRFVPAATTLFPNDAPARECLVRVGETVPTGAFGTYRFWMTRAAFDFWAARETSSNEDVDTTFVYGDQRVIYNVGAHYGSSENYSTVLNTPTGTLVGYNLNFPKDDKLLGVKGVRLDWPVRDPTFQREHLMYWLLDQYGLPNNYRRYIHLYINGVKRGSIYEDTQRPNGDAVAEWFSADANGALFKSNPWFEASAAGRINAGTWIKPLLRNFTTTDGQRKLAYYRFNWVPRNIDRTANDYSGIFAMIDAANTTGPAYVASLNAVVDMENWMRTFAMNDLAAYWDAIGNPNSKNTYFYQPQRGGWKLMSYDFDVGLGAGIGIANELPTAPLFAGGVDATINRMYNTPEFRRHYFRALDEAVNSFFQAAAVTPFLTERYAAFQANGIPAVSPFVGSGSQGKSVTGWITERRNFLLSQLAEVSANFGVDSPTDFSTDNNLLVLTGTAPISVKSIAVNGVPQAVTWTSVTAWSLRLALQAGLNTLAIAGWDRSGHPVAGASQNLSVTFTGATASPVDVVVINEIMYHPLAGDSAFIELYNTSPSLSFDLSGWRVNGVDYSFPPGAIISPGEYLVLAKDPAALHQEFGGEIPVFGEWNGNLDRGGETLTLLMPGALPDSEIVVDRVTYDDAPPWPTAADGQGVSLQLSDALQDNRRVSNWSDGQGWRFFSFTASVGSSGGSRLSFYVNTTGGDVFLDDIHLAAGDLAEAGPNLLTNPGFEAGLTAWGLGPLATNSLLLTNEAHSGNHSLHLIITPGGASLTTFYQDLAPLTKSTNHTLSFWYKAGSGGSPLRARINSLFWPSLTLAQISATPGAMNAGAVALPPYPPVWLSEVQPINETTMRDNAGEYDPWIELHNHGAEALSLDDVYLSDQLGRLTAWPFPAGAQLQPGEYRVVWADGQPEQADATHWHTSFRINATNGMVLLSRLLNGSPQILDYLPYQGGEPDQSFGSHPPAQNSRRQWFDYPTPGNPNDPSAIPVRVWINEWMAANSGRVRDPADQDAEDWFELYNPNAAAVDLAGYRLTDNPANPAKFVIPAGFAIPPGEFLNVWADEEGGQTRPPDQLHVNFRLSASGEMILLLAPDGQLVDSVSFGPQTENVSQGRFPDGTSAPYVHLTVPTPGRSNTLVSVPPEVTILSVEYAAGGLTLSWTAEPGRTYRVQFKADLAAPVWRDLSGDVRAASESASKADPTAPGQAQRFYRVVRVE